MDSPQHPDPGSYKLNSDDYENIWLRIKDRTRTQVYMTWGLLAAVVAIIAFLFFQNLTSFAKGKTNAYIASYVKSDIFKQQISSTFQDQFTMVDKKLKLIDDGLAKLDIYKSAPVKVSDYGFTLVDDKGHYVMVEYGSGSSAGATFKSKFKDPPVVLVTAETKAFAGRSQREEPTGVISVTKDGFRASEFPHRPYDIKWIAIGK